MAQTTTHKEAAMPSPALEALSVQLDETADLVRDLTRGPLVDMDALGDAYALVEEAHSLLVTAANRVAARVASRRRFEQAREAEDRG